jgi:alkylation response protein AidB-like acyl-CoA dehydrogenase
VTRDQTTTTTTSAASLASHLPDQLGWTGDHDLLRVTARRLLSERCPIREVRRLAGDSIGFDRALWRELAELGWTGLHLPERVGGAGLDHLSMALVLEEAGRALYPGPLLEAALAGLAVARAGAPEQSASLLPDIAAGRAIATIALVEGASSWQLDAVTCAAEPAGGGYLLRGEKVHVPWAKAADLLIAPFRCEGGISLFAVPLSGAGVEIEAEVPLDATRRIARVRMGGAQVPAGARLTGADGDAALRDLLAPALVYLAAELAGAAGAALDMTCAYARERVQFDRPIGAFQAVKHPLVDVLIAVERARSLALGAAAALDHAPGEALRAARMAKVAAEQALLHASDRAVQLHGGFGFTWDCDAHLYYKRALAGAATWGDALHHRRALVADLRAAAGVAAEVAR